MKYLALSVLLLSQSVPALAEDRIDPSVLKSAFPSSVDGFTRFEPEYAEAPSYTGEKGVATARYSSDKGGSNAVEVWLKFSDLGTAAGKTFAEYGADYLKGSVSNETQHSITVQTMPGLATDMGFGQWQIETFIAPRLNISASCRNATEEECVAFFNRIDLNALKRLAEAN